MKVNNFKKDSEEEFDTKSIPQYTLPEGTYLSYDDEQEQMVNNIVDKSEAVIYAHDNKIEGFKDVDIKPVMENLRRAKLLKRIFKEKRPYERGLMIKSHLDK